MVHRHITEWKVLLTPVCLASLPHTRVCVCLFVYLSCSLTTSTEGHQPTFSPLRRNSSGEELLGSWKAITESIHSQAQRDTIPSYSQHCPAEATVLHGLAPTYGEAQVEKYYIDLGSKPRADKQLPSWWLLFLAKAPAEPKLLLAKNRHSRLSQDRKHASPFQREMIHSSHLLLLWVLKRLSLNIPTRNSVTLTHNISSWVWSRHSRVKMFHI